jgi:DNA-binding NtrC family response regulator
VAEYFIRRFAQRSGKRIQGISRKSIDLLEANSWPGNIRELQNIIERAVILADAPNLSIDPNWLSPKLAPPPASPLSPGNALMIQERDAIESALLETKGRVAGPYGAAVKLGIPSTTLESKIRSLRIDKHKFKNERRV